MSNTDRCEPHRFSQLTPANKNGTKDGIAAPSEATAVTKWVGINPAWSLTQPTKRFLWCVCSKAWVRLQKLAYFCVKFTHQRFLPSLAINARMFHTIRADFRRSLYQWTLLRPLNYVLLRRCQVRLKLLVCGRTMRGRAHSFTNPYLNTTEKSRSSLRCPRG